MKPEKRSAPQPARPLGRVITVASGKGGVGKTWFSITLAQAMGRRGQNVLLFDGDLGLANVDIQLGLMPERDLGGAIGGGASLKDSTTHYEEGGFDILAGRSGSGSLAALSGEKLTGLHDSLATLSMDYDRTIIDLGAGVENSVRALVDTSGTLLILTTDEPTALTDAYAFIKLTVLDKPKTDIRIVINMADSERSGEKTYGTLLKACQNFLKISPPLAGIIRRDNKVKESIRNQTPHLTGFPGSSAALDVEALANRLLKAP